MSKETNRLRSGIVTSLDAAAQSFGFIGPVFVVAFLTNYVASGAGYATPLAALISGLASIAIGYVIAQFAIRYKAAGSIYTYLAQVLGPSHGFMGGWIYMFGVMALTIAIVPAVAGWISGFLRDYASINVSWLAVMGAEVIALYLLSYFDVRHSTRFQLTVVAVSVLAVLALALTIILTGGAAGNSLAPFSPVSAGGIGNLAFGLVFGLLLYTGYESAAVLAEETSDSKRVIPLAIVGSAALATIFYVIITYAYAIGFGPEGASAWPDDAAVLFTMAAMYWGEWAVPLFFAIAIIDAFVVATATLNTIARVLYAMGRDGALPSVLGRTHSKYQTPHIANGVVLILALMIALCFSQTEGSWELELGLLGGVGGIAVELTYIYTAVAAIVHFRRVLGREYSIFKHLVVPIIALVAPSAALYGSVLPQGGILNAMPYVVLIWLVTGIVVIRVLHANKSALISKIGTNLGIEEIALTTSPTQSDSTKTEGKKQ